MEQHNYTKSDSFLERNRLSLFSLAVLSVVALWSSNVLDIGWSRFARGVPSVLGIFGGMLPPNMEYLGLVWQGLLESFHMALLGTVLAALLAIPAGFLVARNISKHIALRRTCTFILSAMRILPVVLLAIIIMPGVGSGPLCGVLALSIYSIGILGKLYAAAIESIDPSPSEAVASVLPQVLPKFVSLTLCRLESNIRVSMILGVVGAGGIGQILMANLTYRIWPNVGIITLGILLMIMVCERINSWLRNKLV